MTEKPGVKTSEFWTTAIVNLLLALGAAAVVFNVATAEQSDAIVTIGKALIPIALAAAGVYNTARYTQARTELKKTYAETAGRGR